MCRRQSASNAVFVIVIYIIPLLTLFFNCYNVVTIRDEHYFEGIFTCRFMDFLLIWSFVLYFRDRWEFFAVTAFIFARAEMNKFLDCVIVINKHVFTLTFCFKWDFFNRHFLLHLYWGLDINYIDINQAILNDWRGVRRQIKEGHW